MTVALGRNYDLTSPDLSDAQRREMVGIIARRLAGFGDDQPATIWSRPLYIDGRHVTVGEFRRYREANAKGRKP